MFQWGSIKSGIFDSVLLTVPSFIQAYISETSNGMKTAQSILESTLPLHSQIFRHLYFKSFLTFFFSQSTQNINVLLLKKRRKAHCSKC